MAYHGVLNNSNSLLIFIFREKAEVYGPALLDMEQVYTHAS